MAVVRKHIRKYKIEEKDFCSNKNKEIIKHFYLCLGRIDKYGQYKSVTSGGCVNKKSTIKASRSF